LKLSAAAKGVKSFEELPWQFSPKAFCARKNNAGDKVPYSIILKLVA
jgi:hypothetical protein